MVPIPDSINFAGSAACAEVCSLRVFLLAKFVVCWFICTLVPFLWWIMNQCWNRVFGSRISGSPGQQFGTGRVGSGRVRGQYDRPGVWLGFCSFCTSFIVAFGREYTTYGILCILCVFTSWLVCLLHRPETFGRKHSLVAHCCQKNLSIQSTDAQWPGRVTGQRFHLWGELQILNPRAVPRAMQSANITHSHGSARVL